MVVTQTWLLVLMRHQAVMTICVSRQFSGARMVRSGGRTGRRQCPDVISWMVPGIDCRPGQGHSELVLPIGAPMPWSYLWSCMLPGTTSNPIETSGHPAAR